MTNEELAAIRRKAKEGVSVSCDENHPHCALRGCLYGDPKDVIICKLVETIVAERAAVKDLMAKLGVEKW